MRLTYTWMVTLVVIIAEFGQCRGQSITWQNHYIYKNFSLGLVSLQLLNCNHFSSNRQSTRIIIWRCCKSTWNLNWLAKESYHRQFLCKMVLYYYASITWNYLYKIFSKERVISRGYEILWPPCSPDLNPLNYLFWGTLKTRVFNNDAP